MIKSLRWRFIAIAMLSLFATFTVLFTAINVGNHVISTSRADAAIKILYENDGEFPLPGTSSNKTFGGFLSGFRITPETAFEVRYFVVYLTADYVVTRVNMDHIAAYDRLNIVSCVSDIVNSHRMSGYTGQYRFGVFLSDTGERTIVVIDCFSQLQSMTALLRLSILVAFSCLIIVFILLTLLSKRVVRPIEENIERQKRFVTDASHELKTPLTIISANTDILEYSIGENEWIESTKAQISRLDSITKSLIELASGSETIDRSKTSPFCLSDLVKDVAYSFSSIILSQGKTFEDAITPDIDISGMSESIFRLVSILMDNAVKYCDDGGRIRVALSARYKGAYLTFQNTCKGVDPASVSNFFDRFYRADPSRNQEKEGYGIGLSVARSIVDQHGGKISAEYINGEILFSVFLPFKI